MAISNDNLKQYRMGMIFRLRDSLIDERDFPDMKFVEIGQVDDENLDRWMDNLIRSIDGYTGPIFLPLAFGSTWSDFLGLRLAMHIRCTPSSFQLSNIFIYGTEQLYSFRHHEFACMVNSKGIEVIEYNFHALKQASKLTTATLSQEELDDEMSKIYLDVPTNYHDNHSIANIWGMHRILAIAGIPAYEIKSLQAERNQLCNIYFKWLLTKNAHIENDK